MGPCRSPNAFRSCCCTKVLARSRCGATFRKHWPSVPTVVCWPTAASGTANPIAPAKPHTVELHARRGALLPEMLDAAGIDRAILSRSQRWRIDRSHHGGGVAVAGCGARPRSPACLRRRRVADEHRTDEAPLGHARTFAIGWRATTATSTSRSTAGTMCGWIRQFRDWNLESYLPRVSVPCSADPGRPGRVRNAEADRRDRAPARRADDTADSEGDADTPLIAISRRRCSTQSRRWCQAISDS